MKKLLSIFILTLIMSFSTNIYAHCGNAEAHAKASEDQSHDENSEKEKKEKDKS